MNNVFLSGPNCSRAAGAFSTGGCQFQESDVQFDYNVVSGPERIINYRGAQYKDAEALGARTQFRHNSSAMPTFVNPAAGDFRLTAADSVAKDAGADLSSLTNLLPDIVRDLEGITRPQGPAWDIGAHENPSAKPGSTIP